MHATVAGSRLCAGACTTGRTPRSPTAYDNRSDLKLTSTHPSGIASAEPSLSPRKALVVAVSATADSTNGAAHRVRLNSAYVRALEAAGLIPLVVPPLSSESAARDILSRVDGLVLTGGEDVEPSQYEQERSPKCGEPNPARDRTEIALIRAAADMKIPVLAICRGPQVLNVALGGSLIQDIPNEVPTALEHNVKDQRGGRVHEVNIEPDSLTARAIGETTIRVNSLHHQSASRIAGSLRVSARAPDGIVEGLESASDDWWVIAVQWHPEEMNESDEEWDRGIFRAFAARLSR
ncbi:MAG: gamma-glutamyl-gamma-aminobutyrate hydrolase family protein [Gemmatimonadaceae bacterium]